MALRRGDIVRTAHGTFVILDRYSTNIDYDVVAQKLTKDYKLTGKPKVYTGLKSDPSRTVFARCELIGHMPVSSEVVYSVSSEKAELFDFERVT